MKNSLALWTSRHKACWYNIEPKQMLKRVVSKVYPDCQAQSFVCEIQDSIWALKDKKKCLTIFCEK